MNNIDEKLLALSKLNVEVNTNIQAIIIAIFGVVITMFLFFKIWNLISNQKKSMKFKSYMKNHKDIEVLAFNSSGVPTYVRFDNKNIKL